MRKDGFVNVDSVLHHVNISSQQLHNLVDNDVKKRFKIVIENGIEMIRACQGHSLEFIDPELLFTKIKHVLILPWLRGLLFMVHT